MYLVGPKRTFLYQPARAWANQVAKVQSHNNHSEELNPQPLSYNGHNKSLEDAGLPCL